MKGLLLLIFICFVYYHYCKYYELQYYNLYFIISVVAYIVFYYLINYQTGFTYKIANNLKNVHSQPLHTLLPDYNKPYNPTKVEILSKQHFRCNKCKTEITINNIDNSMLSYIQPLDIGGNTIQNLQVVCKHCFQY